MISPKPTNSPIRVSSIVENTVPKSIDWYHSRSVQKLVKMAKATTRTAAMIKVGRIALRRPLIRVVLTRFHSCLL